MTDPVKPRRAYRSTRRAELVAQTRRDIVMSAGQAFRERGYVGVTMPSIADAAGVGVETIYRAFGSKAGLFKAVIDAAVAGGPSRAEVDGRGTHPPSGPSSTNPIRAGRSSCTPPRSPASTAARARSSWPSPEPPPPTRSSARCGMRSRAPGSRARAASSACWPSAEPFDRDSRSRTAARSSGRCARSRCTTRSSRGAAGARNATRPGSPRSLIDQLLSAPAASPWRIVD